MSQYYCNKCGYIGGNIEHNVSKGGKCNYMAVVYPNKTDPVVTAVCEDLQRRSSVGIKKYGTTLYDNMGDQRYWLNHAYEEALDLANYLKRELMRIDMHADDGK